MAILWPFVLGLFTAASAVATGCSELPTVDLGYELHQAISFNETGQYYNFSNIRYARDPSGDLRFAAPQPPLQNRTSVQRGETNVACPQAFAVWYLCGLAQLSGTIKSTKDCGPSLLPPPDPAEREDCLFLDVIVPRSIFDSRKSKPAPVMVWVYGGGFAFGKKGQDGNPAGLLAQSQQVDPEGRGIIYVQFNYRGGAFGFLQGPSVQANGTANAGLLDQRMALEWVQHHIHNFGGDPKRVTVFGQSAGGGSILHQITAHGGSNGPAPFQKAIMQSPGFPLVASRYQQENLTQRFLQHLNLSTISEARKQPYEALYAANVAMVANSNYGTFTWAPAPDNDFVPGLPGTLLSQGLYDKSVKIMTGFNSHETLYFTSPNNTDNAFFVSNLKTTFLGIQESVINDVSEILYPPIFNTTLYSDFFSRAELALAESAFTCNTYYLQKAFRQFSSTYGYRFNIPPGYHGEDVPYTFYNGPNGDINASVAIPLQRHLTSFAIRGNPNRGAQVRMPVYGSEGLILDLTPEGEQVISDPNHNDRCSWWQQSLYY
ncbi:hypothetical protein FP744_10003390 [Trichoderma asperellum]|nr:alpha/beta-hydrolase [Trichoderma asperelloides]